MDIHKWLEETVERESAQRPAQTTTSNFFCPPELPRRVFGTKRAPQHTKSDSSILAPQPHLHVAPPKAPSLPAEDDTGASACSEATGPSQNSSAGSKSSSHCYARRPRHKTRLERYEPKRSKESRKHVHPSRKDKPKKSVSRSKNNKRKKPDSAVGQTFHANNVCNGRLTMKPREQLGLFNKGKTSTAVRGRGLPDLVFSEMKFLQKEQPSLEPNLQHVVTKKKRKKDVQTKEGEISAYFTSARQVLAEKDVNAQSQSVPNSTDMAANNRGHEQMQMRKSSDVVPTIEMFDKGAYLGFGNRGPRHESTSYVSWSELVREPDMASSRLKQPSASHLKHAESSKSDWMRHISSNAQYARGTQTTPQAESFAKNSSVERFRISSAVAPRSRASRSHSQPQHCSSPRKVNLVDRAAKFRSAESIASPSTLPPRAIDERPLREAKLNATTRGQCYSHATAADVLQQQNSASEMGRFPTDGERHTSSDLENIIRHCDHSVLHRNWTAEHLEDAFTARDRDANDTNKGATLLTAQSEARRRLNVRFSQVEVPCSIEALTYTGPSFYERQAAEEQAALLDREDFTDMNESCLDGEQDWADRSELLYDEGDLMGGFDGSEVVHVAEDRVQKLPSDDGVVARGFWRPNKLY